MAPRKLDKAEWHRFLDGMTKALKGKRAELEVDSLVLGSQIEAEWLPLLGIAYDPKDDIVEIALEGLDHLIPKPRELYVDIGADGLTSLNIIARDDTQQIVKLRDPLMLPPPSAWHRKASTGEAGQR